VLHFEDFATGQAIELGERTLSEEEIVEFAREVDPQYFHIDPAAAVDGPFGGLVASGWHTAVVWMRMYVDAVLSRTAGMGGAGVEELRWFVPTRPGDRLRGRFVVLDLTPSSHRPERGTIRFQGELLNQNDDLALRMRGKGYIRRRVPS
jgi:acyl dehydratase